MSLKKGSKIDGGYATVAIEEGINYREIAEMMTDIGFTMNHSSARNYVLRVMRKFAEAFIAKYDIEVDESGLDNIAKSPDFQQGIADVLGAIEGRRLQMMRSEVDHT